MPSTSPPRHTAAMRTMVAILLLLAVSMLSSWCTAATPTLAFFDMNNSRILATTGTGVTVSFGERSSFLSPYDPSPLVALAPLNLSGSEDAYPSRPLEFLIVPYCIDELTATTSCDLRHNILYLMFRFRHQYETSFEAVVWQDATPTSATLKALQAFEAQLNRSDVVYPPKGGSTRVEDTASCSELTDECYLSHSATYTRSYKGMDPSQYSARLFFRLGEQYAINSPLRVRLHNRLPHDAETVVDVVVVLNRMPSFHPLDPRWWTESVLGRIALLLTSAVVTLGFLTVTKEAAALLARQRRGGDLPPPSPLFAVEDEEGVFTFLQRVATVARNALQKAATYVWAKLQALRCLDAGGMTCWRWMPTRHRLVPSSELITDAEREIAVLPEAAHIGVEEEEEEDAAPTCRICRCAEPRHDLFAPCACNGSSKYVHHRCLEQWRDMTTNPAHRLVCAECKTPYLLLRVVVPHHTNLITRSPIIEPAIRYYVANGLSVCMTGGFAFGGAYGLKLAFFILGCLDTGVDWHFTNGYHWLLTLYFLVALALNLAIMKPLVHDIASAEVQLLLVLVSLVCIEVPVSFGTSALLSLVFDRLFTWEVSYGVGLAMTALLHAMDTFSNYLEVLNSFAEERDVVLARTETTEEQEEGRP